MRLQRHVVARKDQWLVALPAELRRHLPLVPGAAVWWHLGTRGRATLTVSGRLRGGRPTLDADCSSCAKYRAELDRLRREVRESTAATPGQHWREGYMRALGDIGSTKADLEVALVLLKEIAAQVRYLRPGGPARAASPPRARRPRRQVDAIPLPDLPSSPEVIDGGAGTPGAEPPGAPLHT
jgi:hypothetical protein